jgi:hypothetical protein
LLCVVAVGSVGDYLDKLQGVEQTVSTSHTIPCSSAIITFLIFGAGCDEAQRCANVARYPVAGR